MLQSLGYEAARLGGIAGRQGTQGGDKLTDEQLNALLSHGAGSALLGLGLGLGDALGPHVAAVQAEP